MPLSEFDYHLFMDTFLPLLHFTAIRHGLIDPKTSFISFVKNRDFKLKFECRQKLYQDPDLLKGYMDKNSSHLSIDQKAILSGINKRISGKFIIYKLLSNRAIFVDMNNIFYSVHDLSDPFDSMIEDVPCLVEATILPFQKRIIYDGFTQPYGVTLGPNLLKSYRENYKAAKEKGQIRTEL
ncbi:MAG: hypothetical protein IPP15_16280 [Saprospiraceae bacterium]|uniref:Uncharacterized protein n=1 Tax=Candidatus Opimibacter skivensis TaxID=2982028 RepID=A0A9D7SVJ2_9BACT|nr:hypothetical protein [Candidatus Opimibacter skivensis]